MKPTYQVFLPGTDRQKDAVQELLESVFPSVLFLAEERYKSLAGPMRNIRAYVELENEGVLTDRQVQALGSLGLGVQNYLFSMRWEDGELEAVQAKEKEESLKLWQELNKKDTAKFGRLNKKCDAGEV